MEGSPAGPRAVEGTVTAQLPSALYRVALEGGREVTAHLGGDPRRNFIRVLIGDRVRVDAGAGRSDPGTDRREVVGDDSLG